MVLSNADVKLSDFVDLTDEDSDVILTYADNTGLMLSDDGVLMMMVMMMMMW